MPRGSTAGCTGWTASSRSGSVYLLGKIRLEGEQDRYASACCVVRNVERSFFVLPRVDPDRYRYGMKDVRDEGRLGGSEIKCN